jgi:hypothetical protein
MFKQLILDAFDTGPKSIEELHALAKEKQPGDCTSEPCPHRKNPGNSYPEWRHQMRRDLAELARKGKIRNENRKWHLVQ